jgi:hypothetical protein
MARFWYTIASLRSFALRSLASSIGKIEFDRQRELKIALTHHDCHS